MWRWTIVCFSIILVVSFAAEFKSALFRPSANCLRLQSAAISTPTTYSGCARACLAFDDCVGFVHVSTSCNLSNALIDPAAHPSCVSGETGYESDLAVAVSCDSGDGWEYNSVRQTCLKAFHDVVRRSDAQAHCESLGGYLVILDTEEALQVLRDLKNTDRSQWSGNGAGFWTDARKLEEVWQWSSGSTWINWNANQPGGNGACAQVWVGSYEMDDIRCTDTRQYVCEKDLSS